MPIEFEEVVRALHKIAEDSVRDQKKFAKAKVSEWDNVDTNLYGIFVFDMLGEINRVNDIGRFLAKEFNGQYTPFNSDGPVCEMWKIYTDKFKSAKTQ